MTRIRPIAPPPPPSATPATADPAAPNVLDLGWVE